MIGRGRIETFARCGEEQRGFQPFSKRTNSTLFASMHVMLSMHLVAEVWIRREKGGKGIKEETTTQALPTDTSANTGHRRLERPTGRTDSPCATIRRVRPSKQAE